MELGLRANKLKSLRQVKEHLQSSALLVHFDSIKELLVYADASPYGLRAVLAHKTSDSSEKAIAFTSCTLTPAECNYFKLEKEALATIFTVKHFHHESSSSIGLSNNSTLGTITQLSTNQGRVCPQLIPSVDYLFKLL